MIRLGTLFSGIGAIEQALLRMGIPHSLIFACDNGELDLKLLPHEEQLEYEKLKKKGKKISLNERNRLIELKQQEDLIIMRHFEIIQSLPQIYDKKKYVDSLYDKYSKGINYVKQSYLANYKLDEENFHLDVHFLDGRDYKDSVDLMVGGSPCQAFSTNGKRGGFNDTRGTLFHEYARLIDEIQPKCFIFENVKGLLHHDNGKTWDTIKNTFNELNYDIYLNKDENGNEQPILNSKDYGIPQNRERIFLIGIKKGIPLKNAFCFPPKKQLMKTNADFLDKEVSAKYYLGEKGFKFVSTHPTRAQVGYTIQKCQKANQQFNWNGDFIFEPINNKHSTEIMNRAYVGDWKGQKGVIRMYTPRECLRLMGFPDSFKMIHKDNIMWRQSGNSIVVDVLIAIMNQLIKTGIFEQ